MAHLHRNTVALHLAGEIHEAAKIAGQQPGYIINALKAYKSGERSHPSMRGIAASLSEEDMKKLADYYGGGK